MVDTLAEGSDWERGETEAGTTGKKSGVKLVGIICNNAETSVGGVSVVQNESTSISKEYNKTLVAKPTPAPLKAIRTHAPNKQRNKETPTSP